MDKIQKRKGYYKCTTMVVIAAILYSLVYYLPQNHTNSAQKNVTASGDEGDVIKLRDFVRVCSAVSLWMFVFVTVNFLHRICLLVEELGHRKTRYSGSCKKLFLAVFCSAWNKIYIYGTIFTIVMCVLYDYTVFLETFKSNIFLLTLTTIVLLGWITIKGWSDTEFEHSDSCSPSIGTAMAYGACYSYYQNVLQNLEERMNEAEKQNNIKIAVRKLFLLFPSSGSLQSDLSDATGGIKSVADLPDINKDKGGTLGRKMTNPIWKISLGDEKTVYCVVEGVNCLSTLKQMNLPEDVFRQQAFLLYMTLKQILDGFGYKNSYILLCYEDENDESQSLRDIIWAKCEELLNRG